MMSHPKHKGKEPSEVISPQLRFSVLLGVFTLAWSACIPVVAWNPLWWQWLCHAVSKDYNSTHAELPCLRPGLQEMEKMLITQSEMNSVLSVAQKK